MHKKSFLVSYIVVIITTIITIITINYFALKILDGTRAFTAGESSFTKGQQEATRCLTLYIFTKNEDYFKKFNTNLHIPISDSLARINLDQKGPEEISRKHFINGGNSSYDVEKMIWIYKNFKDAAAFKSAVDIWKEADLLIMDLEKTGNDIHQKILKQKLIQDQEEKNLALQVNSISDQLTKKGKEFDAVLAKSIRYINNVTLYFITIGAILMILCIVLYSAFFIKKLSALQKKTNSQNQFLTQINNELDMFTYSVSHDLRAPITSLKGLIKLAETEKKPEVLKEYYTMMHTLTSRQDAFIQEIINFSKNKRIEVINEDIELIPFFNHIISDLQFMVEDKEVDFSMDISINKIYSNLFRLNIIFSNLVSNAIKYYDSEKKLIKIKIKAYQEGQFNIFTVEDNGSGIEEQHQAKIFDMFFVTNHHEKGTGIGLYLVKEIVTKLNGTIDVYSIYKQGTCFTIKLPLNNQLG
ncbi:sensor histidine kinase [Pedobacter montanisoli]|uniref:histidine kinase n=1 Tax=Pedobacter montanisoli TaxID=2923277 RepID=A0ABS9ZUK5_9SPHI|nr:HAMP domain-containing sensor histidine kinase [Pedobacter montanisoli]MCJ0742247.1 HAMP domain-containing histidine kinase [Pedobacter montanisoli]